MAKQATGRFRMWLIISAVLAALLLVVANSALWANRYLFSTENFTATATPALTSESSRQAIAGEITDQALADYPRVRNLVDDTATNLISGLLDTQAVRNVTERAVSKLQVVLTSPERPPVVLNLEGLKDTLTKVIEISGRQDEAKIDPAAIPNQIVLFDPSGLPNFYSASVTLGWLSPLAILVAIALLTWPFVAQRSRYLEITLTQGGIIVLFGLLALALGPLFRPAVLSSVDTANLRVVVGNLYDAFIATFNGQSAVIFTIGGLLIAIGGIIYLIQRYRTK